MVRSPVARRTAAAQAAWYVPTGVLPFVSRRAFEALTGSKREWWLVQTVGGLVTAVGVALGLAARRDDVTPELALAAAGSAATLGAIDVVHVARGRLPPTYLLDAVIEGALLAGWARAAVDRARPPDPPAAAPAP
jgi:hypothetical protein